MCVRQRTKWISFELRVSDGSISPFITVHHSNTTKMMPKMLLFCKNHKILSVAQNLHAYIYWINFYSVPGTKELQFGCFLIARWSCRHLQLFVIERLSCHHLQLSNGWLSWFLLTLFRLRSDLSNSKRLIQGTNVLKCFELLFTPSLGVSGNISVFPVIYPTIVLEQNVTFYLLQTWTRYRQTATLHYVPF
jgi:hypothetical protein